DDALGADLAAAGRDFPERAVALDCRDVAAAPEARAQRLGLGDHGIGTLQRIDLALARTPFGGDGDVTDAGLQCAQLVRSNKLRLDTVAFLQRDLALEEF